MAINDDDDFEPLAAAAGSPDDEDDFEPLAATAADMASEGAGARAADAFRASKAKTVTIDGNDLRGRGGSGDAFATSAVDSALGTFGVGLDEAGGAIKGFTEAKDIRQMIPSYRRERDAIRERMDTLRADNPGASLAGGVVGGLASAAVPFGAAVKAGKAATAGGRVLAAAKAGASSGAKFGAAAGLAQSDADLTRGEVLDAVKDVGTGALVGGAVGGALSGGGTAAVEGFRKATRGLVDKATARVEKRAINDLLEGVPAKLQDNSLARLGGKDGAIKVVKEEGLEKAIRGPLDELDDIVGKKKTEAGQKIGAFVKSFDDAAPGGTTIDKLTSQMEELRMSYAKRGDAPAVAAIKSEIDGLTSIFADQGGRVSADGLHAIRSRLGGKGWGKNFIGDPTQAQKISRELYDAADKVFVGHVDDVVKANPSMAGVDEFRALNKQYSRMKGLEDLVEAKSVRAERNSPTLGQRGMQWIKAGADISALGTAASSLATGNLGLAAAAAALPVAARTLPKAAAAVDRAIVDRAAAALPREQAFPQLLSAAAKGAPREEIMALAGRLGVSERTTASLLKIAAGRNKGAIARKALTGTVPREQAKD